VPSDLIGRSSVIRPDTGAHDPAGRTNERTLAAFGIHALEHSKSRGATEWDDDEVSDIECSRKGSCRIGRKSGHNADDVSDWAAKPLRTPAKISSAPRPTSTSLHEAPAGERAPQVRRFNSRARFFLYSPRLITVAFCFLSCFSPSGLTVERQ
jgi:hypothetical protein